MRRLMLMGLLFIPFIQCLAQKNKQPEKQDDKLKYKGASAYFAQINSSQDDMNRQYMIFMSISAHKKKERKINRAKQNTLESMIKCRHKLVDMPAFEADDSLRKAAINYVQVCIDVFNEDYDHLVNLEEISEQSIDKMEAYINLRKQVNIKTSQAALNFNNAELYFAKKFNLHLIEETSDLGKQLMTAAHLNHYLTDIHFIFFKCGWEEFQMTKAVNNHNVLEIEQARTALLKYSQEGLSALTSDSLRNFEKDTTLSNACKRLLTFYVKLTQIDIPKLESFWLDDENQQKIKSSITSKQSNYKTKEDMQAYDMATKKMDANKKNLQDLIDRINSKHKDNIENWNTAESDFEDQHMPYLKK